MAVGDERSSRELRVRIDGDQHQKLHALKVLRNKTMTDAIREALDHYFANVVPGLPSPGDEPPRL